MENKKTKVVVIMGPTATGKTGLAVDLAGTVGGEIISADSRQVYKDMDIGSGKDLDEYQGVKHHLIDVREAGAEFSVSDFQTEALKSLEIIKAKAKIPIICGGTGYYIKALLEDYRFDYLSSDLELTGKMEALTREELYQKLKELNLWEEHDWRSDSKRRAVRRIEKALTVPLKSESKFGFRKNYLPRIYHTDVERRLLKENIGKRLRDRLDEGMIREVQKLLEKGVSFQRLERYGLEYKWGARYLKGEINRQTMIEKLEVEICRFAKRQMTFIRYMEKSGHKTRPIKNKEAFLKEAGDWTRSG